MKKLTRIPRTALFLAILLLVTLTGCPTDSDDPLKQDDKKLPGTALTGTRWTWSGLILTFTGDTAALSSTSSTDYLYYYWYTYNINTKTGSIVFDQAINVLTPENPADLGKFTINESNNILTFAQYKGYPHGADFVRTPDM
jgi:hypothetical protein